MKKSSNLKIDATTFESEGKLCKIDDESIIRELEKSKAPAGYYGRLSYWNISERVLLSLDKNPIIVTVDFIDAYLFKLSFGMEYISRCAMLKRALKLKEVTRYDKPCEIIKWFENRGLGFNPKLKKIIYKYNNTDTTPPYLNQYHPYYSNKLAAAIETHKYLTDNVDKIKGKTVKRFALEYLEKNAARLGLMKKGKLNKQSTEEIAKIVNWCDEGGAPKTL